MPYGIVYSLAEPVGGAVRFVGATTLSLADQVAALVLPRALLRPSRLARWLGRLVRLGSAPVSATLTSSADAPTLVTDLAAAIAAAVGGGAVLLPDTIGSWAAPGVPSADDPAVREIVQRFLRGLGASGTAVLPNNAAARLLTEKLPDTVPGTSSRAELLLEAQRLAAARAALRGR